MHPGDRGRRMAVTSVAVVVIFALSRWGTYLGVEPLYIVDVLLALAFAHHLVSGMRLGEPSPGGVSGVLMPVVLAWMVLRLLFSPTWELITLRDAVPYLYVVVGMFTAWGYAAASPTARLSLARVLRVALYVHLGWVMFTLITGVTGPVLSPTAFVLQIRSDIDAALLAILAGLKLNDLLHGRGPSRCLLVLAACGWGVLQTPNRAGLIALSLGLVFVLMAYLASETRTSGKAAVVLLAPIAALGAWVALPMTTAGARLLSGLGLGSTAYVPDVISARGTTAARLRAWEILINYWTETESRFLFGVGFGPDFLTDSHSATLLGSETFVGVRAPHNYLIGTAVRTGLIGVVLVAALLLVVAACIWVLRRKLSTDPLLLTAGLVIATMVPASMVGVLFEAPFGAVPLFWASGILIAACKLDVPGATAGLDPRPVEVQADRAAPARGRVHLSADPPMKWPHGGVP